MSAREQWLGERPIIFAYDDARQYAVAVMAWQKRKPAPESPTLDEAQVLTRQSGEGK